VADGALRVGPLLKSAHPCTVEYLEELWTPEGTAQVSDEWARTAASIIALHTFNCLGGLTGRMLLNGFLGYERRGATLKTTSSFVPVIYGLETSRPELGPTWRDSFMWRLHEGLSLQSASNESPAAYRTHFSAHNLALHARTFGRHATAPLSSPPALPPASGLGEGGLDVAGLGAIAQLACGYRMAEDGVRVRRIAPSGGDLRSCELFAYAAGVRGLAEGLYRYIPLTHSFERIAGPECREALAARLNLRHMPQCVLLGLADYGRVAQKYSMRAYRIVHFDSGVSAAFAQFQAAFLGLRCDSLPQFDPDLLQPYLHPQLGPRRFLTACALTLTSPNASSVTPNVDELERLVRGVEPNRERLAGPPLDMPIYRCFAGCHAEALDPVLRRRAVRVFAQRALDTGQIDRLHEVLQATLDYGHLPIASDLCAYTIEKSPEPGRGHQIWRFSRHSNPRQVRADVDIELHPKILGQHYPNDAPFIVVIAMDLARQVRTNDAAAGRHALHLAGLIVGHLWIGIATSGLVGTAIGALVVDAVCALTGANGYDEAPILGFCAGFPHQTARALP
jgi:SagB-type dehydrogenase family enzyme